jgi:hypothetical protein
MASSGGCFEFLQAVASPVEELTQTRHYLGAAVMLVCYLDDSGKDPQNRITNIGGYIAKDEEWQAFETEVETWFVEFGVKIVHAKDLHDTDGEFKGWAVLRKEAFVARIYQVMSRHILFGMAVAAAKDAYRRRAGESDRKKTVTPYTFCFNVIIDWILTGIITGKEAHENGVKFILEQGHENNREVEEHFYDIRKRHNLESVLHSISFVGKESCHAIQVADLFSFYSRRYGAALEAAPLNERRKISPARIINVMTERLPHRSFVATDFGPLAGGSRFLAGD